METQHPLGWTEKPEENSVRSMERNLSQSRKRSHDAYATLLELYCCGEEKTTLFFKVFIKKPIHGELCGIQFIELSGSQVRSALPGIDAVCK